MNLDAAAPMLSLILPRYGKTSWCCCTSLHWHDYSLPSDCHVKYGVHSVVKTVCMLLADAVLMKSTATITAHMASPLPSVTC